jgi:hypothetical protein
MGLKVFNGVPAYIKDISYNVKEFKRLFKKFSLFRFFLYVEGVFPIIHSILFKA